MVQQSINCHSVFIPSLMFMASFWCVVSLVSIPRIKWSCCPDVCLYYVCGGAWPLPNFHLVL